MFIIKIGRHLASILSKSDHLCHLISRLLEYAAKEKKRHHDVCREGEKKLLFPLWLHLFAQDARSCHVSACVKS